MDKTEDKTHQKKKKRDKSDLGSDFIAPDGGWGWPVVFASGCSNLCTFAALQVFGILFRERMDSLGITNSEITTIINLSQAFRSCVGSCFLLDYVTWFQAKTFLSIILDSAKCNSRYRID